MAYPLLEHDPSREALTEPSKIIRPRDVPEHVAATHRALRDRYRLWRLPSKKLAASPGQLKSRQGTPKYDSHFIESPPASEGPPATREGKF